MFPLLHANSFGGQAQEHNSERAIDNDSSLCEALCMATNIELDERLVSKAMRLGGMKTKKEAVNEALSEYVQRREQLKVIELFGTVEYDDKFDYKRQRRVQ